MPRTKFLVSLVASGATLIGSAATFVSVLPQLTFEWKLLGFSTIAVLSLVWVYAFMVPGIRQLGSQFLVAMRLSRRISTVEANLSNLWRFVHATNEVSNLSNAVHFTVAMSVNMTSEQAFDRIRANLHLANSAAQTVSQFPERDSFESIILDATGILIVLAGSKGILFDKLAALLLSEIRAQTAKRVVDISAIVQAYGANSATQWHDMVADS